jgi:site-specific recombinase XerC
MARKAKPATRRVLTMADWPALDQRLWLEGTRPTLSVLDAPYAHTLRPTTLRNAAVGYGRMLAVLRDQDLLDPEVMPADRLTRPIADRLLRAFDAAGNTNNTIKARIWEIRQALKVMQPEVDTSWLTQPGAHSLHELLPTSLRPRALVGATTLTNLAMMLLATADDQPTSLRVHLQRRNGLILAILASRAPRIATLAAMRVGLEVRLTDDACWLHLRGDIVKNGRTLEYRTLPALLPHIRRYLEETRPALLNGAQHDAMWIGEEGQQLKLRGIEGIIRRLTQQHFGRPIGPHQSRHELATALAEADPDNPGLAAAVLGISQAVAEKHYIAARAEQAASLFADHLDTERERTRLLAERLFADGR